MLLNPTEMHWWASKLQMPMAWFVNKQECIYMQLHDQACHEILIAHGVQREYLILNVMCETNSDSYRFSNGCKKREFAF
jgi:hypothetical protein